MRVDEWNQLLCSWYFTEAPGSRAYFRVDDAELRRLNAELALGLEDPAADLLHSVRLYGLGYGARAGEKWRRGQPNADDLPPWLPYLAVTVLVVERETERSSTRFYDPVTEVLGLTKRLSQVEYEETFFVWWVELAEWLDVTNRGRRGLATWRRIPRSGLRSVIGHPYTQILLHRDEREDLDEFLVSLEGIEPGDIEIVDEEQAAASLVEEFRRWAVTHSGISPRLRAAMEGSDSSLRQSLGFVLLDRLSDALDRFTDVSYERVIQVVLSLDDWADRELRLSAIAPVDVKPDKPLTLDVNGERIEFYEPGQPARLPIPPSKAILEVGYRAELSPTVSLVFSPRQSYALASRLWNEWCGVRDVQPGESIYLLVRDAEVVDALKLLRSTNNHRIADIPAGWQLLGPAALSADAEPSALGIRTTSDSLPHLVGGLRLDRHLYLRGGEPVLAVPAGVAPSWWMRCR